jgi:hypothetical protein
VRQRELSNQRWIAHQLSEACPLLFPRRELPAKHERCGPILFLTPRFSSQTDRYACTKREWQRRIPESFHVMLAEQILQVSIHSQRMIQPVTSIELQALVGGKQISIGQQ